jgi:hypothetical protein
MENKNRAFTGTGPIKPVGSRAGDHHSLKAWWHESARTELGISGGSQTEPPWRVYSGYEESERLEYHLLVISLPFQMSCVVFHVPSASRFMMLIYLAVDVSARPPCLGIKATSAKPLP